MEDKLVWSDELGDLRKSKTPKDQKPVDEESIVLEIKRLTSGKGRTILEISSLPNNRSWCKKLAKDIKKKLATGGSYKTNIIEVHGEHLEKLTEFLDSLSIKWKKVGG
jgi:translation initiation factor 1